jgi:hypothetical protein
MKNNKELKTELSKRTELLEKSGIDTEGFGLINTFFLSDEIIYKLNKLSSFLYHHGFYKIAIYFSSFKAYQSKTKGFEIRQVIEISSEKGSYTQDCFIHDKDPENDKNYICKKYNLNC